MRCAQGRTHDLIVDVKHKTLRVLRFTPTTVGHYKGNIHVVRDCLRRARSV